MGDALSAPVLGRTKIAVETDTATAAPRNLSNLPLMPHDPITPNGVTLPHCIPYGDHRLQLMTDTNSV